jgi:hypothetical protein
MATSTTGSQDAVDQKTGTVDLNGLYPPAPIDKRKELILKHHILTDRFLTGTFVVLLIIGVLVAKHDSNITVKSVGSGMAGAAITALANRLKDGGGKLSPD